MGNKRSSQFQWKNHSTWTGDYGQ